ncbi:hypothetical protein Tco_0760863 [Tanacetum coccineum]
MLISHLARLTASHSSQEAREEARSSETFIVTWGNQASESKKEEKFKIGEMRAMISSLKYLTDLPKLPDGDVSICFLNNAREKTHITPDAETTPTLKPIPKVKLNPNVFGSCSSSAVRLLSISNFTSKSTPSGCEALNHTQSKKNPHNHVSHYNRSCLTKPPLLRHRIPHPTHSASQISSSNTAAANRVTRTINVELFLNEEYEDELGGVDKVMVVMISRRVSEDEDED